MMIPGRKPSILNVDDDDLILDIARAAFESAGFDVIVRSRGEGTVAEIIQDKPDIVLLDVSMPRTRGDTIASVLSTALPPGQTIVLLYSGMAPELLEAKVLQSGADGFVQKSGDIGDVVSQVEDWLKMRGSK
jgi:two-component system response regulator EvgA